MRTPASLLLSLLLVAVLAPSAAAHPTGALDPTLPTDLTFAATDNITHLGRFPEHAGTAGGFPSADGTRFTVTDPRGVHVYDTTDPADPQLLASLPLYQQQTGAALAQEDPDTDGRILLVDGATTPVGTAQLHVVDVSDPEVGLSVLSTLDVTDHTWTCVTRTGDRRRGPGRAPGDAVARSCDYAYGRTGHIVDLTDPTDPVLLEATWREAVGYGTRGNTPYTHDLTEIRPGLVMSAGADAILMDTSDPTAPVRLRSIDQADRWASLGYHSVEWAGGGTSAYLVAGTEIAPDGPTNTAGSDCAGEDSVIETWDATEVRRGLELYERGATASAAFAGRDFRLADTYAVSGRALFTDGGAPAHVLYCAHWMEPHPSFDETGLLAISYYDRGTRFVTVDVDGDGSMAEHGWIVAAEGYSGSVQWVGRDAAGDIAYVMDYRRGMEVLRIGAAPSQAVVTSGDAAVSPGSLAALDGDGAAHLVEQAATALPALLGIALIGARRGRGRARTRGRGRGRGGAGRSTGAGAHA